MANKFPVVEEVVPEFVDMDMERYQNLLSLVSRGDSSAKNSLGALLANLGGVENERAALYWYLEAVDDGYVDSMWNVGTMLMNGEGGIKDIDFGLFLIKVAAENGSNSACLYISNCYEKGLNEFEKNLSEARKWESRAWDLSNERDYIEPIPVDDYLIDRPEKPD